MISSKIQELIDATQPEEAAMALAHILGKLFPLLEEETRLKMVATLVGTPSDEKVASLVHL